MCINIHVWHRKSIDGYNSVQSVILLHFKHPPLRVPSYTPSLYAPSYAPSLVCTLVYTLPCMHPRIHPPLYAHSYTPSLVCYKRGDRMRLSC